MDKILEIASENDLSVSPLVKILELYDKIYSVVKEQDKKIDNLAKEQRVSRDRSETAINIGLENYSGIKQIKNKLKLNEEHRHSSITPKKPRNTKEVFVSEGKTEKIFNELAKKWKEETVNLSSIQKILMNNAYLQIIGLGPEAIRLILNELQRAPDFWFCALRALTRTNPVPTEMSGDINAMTKVWIDWGQKHGYL